MEVSDSADSACGRSYAALHRAIAPLDQAHILPYLPALVYVVSESTIMSNVDWVQARYDVPQPQS